MAGSQLSHGPAPLWPGHPRLTAPHGGLWAGDLRGLSRALQEPEQFPCPPLDAGAPHCDDRRCPKTRPSVPWGTEPRPPTNVRAPIDPHGRNDPGPLGRQCGRPATWVPRGSPEPHPTPAAAWGRRGAAPTPAHLAASAAQGGWVPTAAGRGGAAARWEVAGETGCEVTCTHLRGAAAVTCHVTPQGLTAPPERPACRATSPRFPCFRR